MFLGNCADALLVEVRDLIDKNGEVWRTTAKISFLGGSLDGVANNLDKKELLKHEGQRISFTGYWEQSQGYSNFILSNVEAAK